MHNDSVKITLVQGEVNDGKTSWVFDKPGDISIGRFSSMQIVIPSKNDYMTISRTNTRIQIRPPRVYVKDFGSKAGTFLDGKLLGKRGDGMTAEEGRKNFSEYTEVKNGSIIGMGAGNGSIVQLKVELPEGKQESKEEIAGKLKKDEKKAQVMETEINGTIVRDIPMTIMMKTLTSEMVEMDSKKTKLQKEEILGTGGFGEVYKARDLTSGKYYAVKEMRSNVELDARNVAYFNRERNISSQLTHKNIVKTYENYFVLEENKCGIIMEYCEGGDLKQLIRSSGGKLSVDRATNIILDLLSALQYAHTVKIHTIDENGNGRVENGLVHRDIKPENILFDRNDVLKLTDFGLAKAFNLTGQSGFSNKGWCGSLPYCPRKQVKSFCYVRPDTDVFAAAAVYFQMLTGRYIRDFRSDALYNPELAIMESEIYRVREVNPDIPKALADIIDGVLSEDDVLGDACTSAEEFSKQIKDALNKY